MRVQRSSSLGRIKSQKLLRWSSLKAEMVLVGQTLMLGRRLTARDAHKQRSESTCQPPQKPSASEIVCPGHCAHIQQQARHYRAAPLGFSVDTLPNRDASQRHHARGAQRLLSHAGEASGAADGDLPHVAKENLPSTRHHPLAFPEAQEPRAHDEEGQRRQQLYIRADRQERHGGSAVGK